LCEKDRVDAEDLTFNLNPDLSHGDGDMTYSGGLAEATSDFQRDYIRRMIKRAQTNMSQAAEMLGLHRSNLYRKMRQLEMEEAGGAE
jgi:Nif-specific regulatory protein